MNADKLYDALDENAPNYISNLIYNLSRFEWTKHMNKTSEKISILDDIRSTLNDTPEDIAIVDRGFILIATKGVRVCREGDDR